MPREKRRAQLLSVARTCFAKHGYQATSMDEIAELASVSKPVLYQHFKSKQDLHHVLINCEFQRLSQQLTEVIDASDEDALRALRAVFVIFDYINENADSYQLIFGEPDTGSLHYAVRNEFLEELVEAIQPYLVEHSTLQSHTRHFLTTSIVRYTLSTAVLWARHYSDFAPDPHSPDNIDVEDAKQMVATVIRSGAYGFELSNNPSADQPSN